jgi:hypothetical protein
MGYNAGDTITDFLTHVDSDGAAITGATLTVVKALKPDGTSFVPTVAEIDSGVYQVSFTTTVDAPGTWYLALKDDATLPIAYFEQAYDVDPYASPAASATISSGATRTAIRQRIGDLIGDLVVCTATDDGSTTTFVDSKNLQRDPAILVGRHLYLSGGTTANLGHSARVSDNAKSSGTLTFSPALPSDTATGDAGELWNTREIGWTVEQIHRCINYSIDDVADLGAMLATNDPAATFTFSSPVVDLPTDWVYFCGVSWQDPSGVWKRIPPANYRVDRINRTLELRNQSRSLASGRSLRLVGATIPGPLAADSDVTNVNVEWLAYQTIAKLSLQSSERHTDPAVRERKAQFWQDLADQRRAINGIRPPGTYIRLA